jgi:hypothetical protein
MRLLPATRTRKGGQRVDLRGEAVQRGLHLGGASELDLHFVAQRGHHLCLVGQRAQNPIEFRTGNVDPLFLENARPVMRLPASLQRGGVPHGRVEPVRRVSETFQSVLH